jgi:hypothetical protein
LTALGNSVAESEYPTAEWHKRVLLLQIRNDRVGIPPTKMKHPPPSSYALMFFSIDAITRRRAKSAHELAIVNLLLINLFVMIALLAGSFAQPGSALSDYKLAGVLVPLAISLAIIGFSFAKASRASAADSWFVTAHWRLATGRYKILLIAYAVGAGLIGLGGLLSQSQPDPRMAGMMFIALQRVAIAPILICVMVLIMLESGSLYQARRGEVPGGVIERFPPPGDLPGAESEQQVDAGPA